MKFTSICFETNDHMTFDGKKLIVRQLIARQLSHTICVAYIRSF